MSIGSLLNTARLGLTAQQIGMDTAGHNIANVNTPGYTRQRVEMTANYPLQTRAGPVGTGVLANSISRIRSALLDNTYRDQTAQSSGYQTRADLVSQISEMFNEPSDTGLSAKMDAFWSSWSDLANNPTNAAAKSVVQQRGADLAQTLNSYTKNLDTIAGSTRLTADGQITDVNRYAAQVATINQQIVSAESDGHTASDLRDARDNLLDSISKIVPIRVNEQNNGSVTVLLGNATLVDGVASRTLSFQSNGANLSLQISGLNGPVKPGGALGAALDVLNTDIPNARAELDTLANQLVTQVNTMHRTGWSAAGDALGGANWDASAPPTGSNVDFFDPANTNASNIKLSAAVAADAGTVAGGNVQNGTGNNALANQMAQLRTSTTSILKHGSTTETTSFASFYQDLVTRVGVSASDATASASVYTTLAQQADARRQSVSGVSTDEELISLTKYQQAYSAAAKVITMADELAQTLLDMVR